MKGLRITQVFARSDCPARDCDFELSGDYAFVMGEIRRDFACGELWTYIIFSDPDGVAWEIWQEPIFGSIEPSGETEEAKALPAVALLDEAETHPGVELIASERRRQVKEEGWTPANDDKHDIGELCSAAACYLFAGDCLANAKRMDAKYDCTPESLKAEIQENDLGIGWPWDMEWLKIDPDPIRSLVKAGALIAAEIDRIQRRDGMGGVR